MSVGSKVSQGLSDGLSKLRRNQQRRSDERFAERFANQWASMHAERREPIEPAVAVETGESNFAPGRVPYGVDLAAAWAWRFLVIVAAGYVVAQGIALFAVVVLPLVIAVLLTALVVPLVDLLERARLPRGLAALVVVLGTIALVALLLTFAGQQIATGASDLSNQVVKALEQIEDWLKTGPLHASDSQINGYIQSAQDAVTSSNKQIVGRLTEVGTAIGHIVAGFFIILFGTYFFLADGDRIWGWLVRIFPRASRGRADSSGRVAWTSLTAFVRATVLVAITDALGIMLGAAILKVPFVIAIGVLVFIGAFIPMIGAFLSGTVAVLVALVDQGPVIALIMLGVVVGVQQLEAHVLQPFLLGRLVRVHPLGVIVAIAAGVLVAGLAGALVAVPFVAAANAVVVHLAEGARADRELEELAGRRRSTRQLGRLARCDRLDGLRRRRVPLAQWLLLEEERHEERDRDEGYGGQERVVQRVGERTGDQAVQRLGQRLDRLHVVRDVSHVAGLRSDIRRGVAEGIGDVHGEPAGEHRPEERGAERAAHLPEERHRAGGDADVAAVDGVLHDGDEHLHRQAEAGAHHVDGDRGVPVRRVGRQPRQQQQRDDHDARPEDREELVAAGARHDLPGGIDVENSPTTIGSSARPDSVGLMPSTTCR